MNKFFKVAIVLVMLLAAVFTAISCNESDGALTFDEDDMPRTTYVQGTDLDLSIGKLLLKNKSESETVALNADSVTHSEYNKNQIGEQEITFFYKNFSVKLTITVIQRLALSNATLDYFEGEKFDRKNGQLLIYDDNAETYEAVDLSNEEIKIDEIDQNEFGKQTLNISYGNYTGTFNIYRYKAQDCRLTAPIDVDYLSHEADINLEGCFITFIPEQSANIDSKIVPVNKDMIRKGTFDLSKADMANREIPLVQKVYVDYPGLPEDKNFFEIKIKYSDISVIGDYAQELGSLDYSKAVDEQGIISWNIDEDRAYIAATESQLKKAEEAITLYLALPEADKDSIAEDELKVILRTAIYENFVKYNQAIRTEFADLFVMNSDNRVELHCDTYEGTKRSYNDFINTSHEDDVAFSSSKFLTDLYYAEKTDETGKVTTTGNPAAKKIQNLELFANKKGNVKLTVNSLSNVGDFANICDSYIPAIGHMIDLYEIMNGVDNATPFPSEWDAQTLISNADKIKAFENKVIKEDESTGDMYLTYGGSAYRSMYEIMSSWRENDDLFKILYTYYYNDAKALEEAGYEKDSAEEKRFNRDWLIMRTYANYYGLPSELEQLYNGVRNTMGELDTMYLYEIFGYTRDNSTYASYYFDFLTKLETLYAQEGMYKELIDKIYFAGWSESGAVTFKDVLPNLNKQYISFLGNMAGIESVDKVWKDYARVYAKDINNTVDDLGVLVRDLLALSPNEFSNFIWSVYPVKDFFACDLVEQDVDGEVKKVPACKTYFAAYIINYFSAKYESLSVEAQNLILKYLSALEYYGHRYRFDEGLEKFFNYAEEASGMYNYFLSSDDKNIFQSDELLVALKQKVDYIESLYEYGELKEMAIPQDYQEEFDELFATIKDLLIVNNTILSYIEQDTMYPAFGLLFNLYERAINQVDTIFEKAETEGDEEIIRKLYYYAEFDIFGEFADYYDELPKANLEYYMNNMYRGLFNKMKLMLDDYQSSFNKGKFMYYYESYELAVTKDSAVRDFMISSAGFEMAAMRQFLRFNNAEFNFAKEGYTDTVVEKLAQDYFALDLADRYFYFTSDQLMITLFRSFHIYYGEKVGDVPENVDEGLFIQLANLEKLYLSFMIAKVYNYDLAEDKTDLEKDYRAALEAVENQIGVVKAMIDDLSGEQKAFFNSTEFAEMFNNYREEIQKIKSGK